MTLNTSAERANVAATSFSAVAVLKPAVPQRESAECAELARQRAAAEAELECVAVLGYN